MTIQGAKFERNDRQNHTPNILIDGYRGELSMGPDQFYVFEPVRRIAAKSSGPLAILLLGNFFYNSMPELDLGPGIILHKFGNGPSPQERADGLPPKGHTAAEFFAAIADTDVQAAGPQIGRTLADLRQLGARTSGSTILRSAKSSSAAPCRESLGNEPAAFAQVEPEAAPATAAAEEGRLCGLGRALKRERQPPKCAAVVVFFCGSRA